MNLIHDAWIPIRRRSGVQERIRPDQITDRLEEDAVAGVASPRPDFDGALLQFWIGLLQTAFAPEDSREWRRRFDAPPPPADLHAAFEPIAHAFCLDGDGPRFMQEISFGNEKPKREPVSHLLIDAPGTQTLDQNKDIFVKRGVMGGLCLPCSAAALLTLQANSPAGGAGHRTGLRGGGPLTTLVWPCGDDGNATLWHALWMNVLERDDFLRTSGNVDRTSEEDSFPWLGPTRVSASGLKTFPQDAHPQHMFWATPRRIRLEFDQGSPKGRPPCGICGDPVDRTITQYRTRPHGPDYQGAWKHPLTPYRTDKKAGLLPLHGPPGGINYRHWLGLVHADPDSQGESASVVRQFWASRARSSRSVFRIRAFGYEMDNMKARCWHEATMPLILAPEGQRQEMELAEISFVLSARQVDLAILQAVKSAFTRRPKDLRGDLSHVSVHFWHATEAGFFERLQKVRDTLVQGGDAGSHVREWLRMLRRQALATFDDLAQTDFLHVLDPARVARARRGLQKRVDGPKIRKILGLPSPKAAKELHPTDPGGDE